MIVKVADSIFSPLGATTDDNYRAVRSGRSELRRHEGKWRLPEPFVASLFADGEIDRAFAAVCADTGGYTPFEKALAVSIAAAVRLSGVDPASPRTAIVIATTKANVELLNPERLPRIPRERTLPGAAAAAVARLLGSPNEPLVVSNACISGVSAQIAAMRMLESGRCDNAIVAGCDVLSPFIVSGFQSFKALSAEECRPFDARRSGLNLGEAAATIVYTRKEAASAGEWVAVRGAVRNDANHISGPSRDGEGSRLALLAAMAGADPGRLAFVNLHGTATAYNDEMEAIAVDRAGMAAVPANGLKGYYGHTLGAAGILETIISARAADDDTVLATRGYGESGVSRPLSVAAANRPAGGKRAFVKLLSGFGGCNAALLMEKGGGQ